MYSTKEHEILNGFFSLLSTWLDKYKGTNGHRFFVVGSDDFHRQLQSSDYIYKLEDVAQTMYDFSKDNEVTDIQVFMDGTIIGTLGVNH